MPCSLQVCFACAHPVLRALNGSARLVPHCCAASVHYPLQRLSRLSRAWERLSQHDVLVSRCSEHGGVCHRSQPPLALATLGAESWPAQMLWTSWRSRQQRLRRPKESRLHSVAPCRQRKASSSRQGYLADWPACAMLCMRDLPASQACGAVVMSFLPCPRQAFRTRRMHVPAACAS